MCEYAAKIEKEIARVCGRSVMIGIGSVSNYLREIATSYKEAQVAIQVGKIFYSDKKIIHYQNLGIGRLIYQLPTTLCEMFLAEVFKKNNIDSLTRRLFTIQRFSKTTSTYRKPPGNCSFTGTRSFTGSRRSRSSPDWTCASLTVRSFSKLL